MSVQGDFAAVARDGGRAALVTVLAGDALGARLLVRADGETAGTLGDAELDARAAELAEELMWAERSERREEDGALLFVDVAAPPPRVVVVGAADPAPQLCEIARTAGWKACVMDPRTRFATRERLPHAHEIVAEWPQEAFPRLGGIDRATYVAVLTHDPKLDDAALGIALRSEARYVGAMGSRRAQARRRERLLEADFSESELERLVAPIGLDLGGLTAQETALAIMAEMVAVRNGRQGGRLAESAGRIHDVA